MKPNEPANPNPNPEFSEEALSKVFNQCALQLWLCLQQFETAGKMLDQLNSLRTSPVEDAIADIMAHTAEARSDLKKAMHKHLAVLKSEPFESVEPIKYERRKK